MEGESVRPPDETDRELCVACDVPAASGTPRLRPPWAFNVAFCCCKAFGAGGAVSRALGPPAAFGPAEEVGPGALPAACELELVAVAFEALGLACDAVGVEGALGGLLTADATAGPPGAGFAAAVSPALALAGALPVCGLISSAFSDTDTQPAGTYG